MDEKRVVSRFIKNKIEMITACFDEYYFIIPEGAIKPIPKNAGKFEIGQTLPIKGETFEFPTSFNIIDFHFKLVGKIRDGKLHDIEPLDEFKYDGEPAVNILGSAIKLSSENDFEDFKKHFASFSLNERDELACFANRWFDIFKYRTVRYQ